MATDDLKRVKRWLYSIPRTELALVNLRKAMEEIEHRLSMTPPNAYDYSRVIVTASAMSSEVEAQAVDLPARRDFLQEWIARHERKLEQYQDTLDAMVDMEPRWGHIGAEIIRYKYYRQIKPDMLIYTGILYCTKETFYRDLGRALYFFLDILPDVFQERRQAG